MLSLCRDEEKEVNRVLSMNMSVLMDSRRISQQIVSQYSRSFVAEVTTNTFEESIVRLRDLLCTFSPPRSAGANCLLSAAERCSVHC